MAFLFLTNDLKDRFWGERSEKDFFPSGSPMLEKLFGLPAWILHGFPDPILKGPILLYKPWKLTLHGCLFPMSRLEFFRRVEGDPSEHGLDPESTLEEKIGKIIFCLSGRIPIVKKKICPLTLLFGQ